MTAVQRESTYRRRYRILMELAALGEPAVDSIVALLEGPDLRPPGARGRAPEYLEHESADVRVGGLAALGTLGSAGGVPLAAARLADESAWVRREAVIALLRIGAPEPRPALERALADPDWEVRVYAAEAVKRL